MLIFLTFFGSLVRMKQLTVSWGQGVWHTLVQCGPNITELWLVIVNLILKAATCFCKEQRDKLLALWHWRFSLGAPWPLSLLILTHTKVTHTMATAFTPFILRHFLTSLTSTSALHSSSLFARTSDSLNICSSWAGPVYFLECVFSTGSGLCGGLTVPSQTRQCLA